MQKKGLGAHFVETRDISELVTKLVSPQGEINQNSLDKILSPLSKKKRDLSIDKKLSTSEEFLYSTFSTQTFTSFSCPITHQVMVHPIQVTVTTEVKTKGKTEVKEFYETYSQEGFEMYLRSVLDPYLNDVETSERSKDFIWLRRKLENSKTSQNALLVLNWLAREEFEPYEAMDIRSPLSRNPLVVPLAPNEMKPFPIDTHLQGTIHQAIDEVYRTLVAVASLVKAASKGQEAQEEKKPKDALLWLKQHKSPEKSAQRAMDALLSGYAF